jgi:hypothetical protein
MVQAMPVRTGVDYYSLKKSCRSSKPEKQVGELTQRLSIGPETIQPFRTIDRHSISRHPLHSLSALNSHSSPHYHVTSLQLWQRPPAAPKTKLVSISPAFPTWSEVILATRNPGHKDQKTRGNRNQGTKYPSSRYELRNQHLDPWSS